MTVSRGVMERALAESLKAAELEPQDAAAAALARRLARLIDCARGEAGDDPAEAREGSESLLVVKLAAEYRQVLAQLCLTPAARAVAKSGGTPDKPTQLETPLQKQRREARARREARETA